MKLCKHFHKPILNIYPEILPNRSKLPQEFRKPYLNLEFFRNPQNGDFYMLKVNLLRAMHMHVPKNSYHLNINQEHLPKNSTKMFMKFIKRG